MVLILGNQGKYFRYRVIASGDTYIKNINQIDDYFLALFERKHRYLIFVYVQDEGQGALTLDTKNNIASLGITQIFNLAYRDSYLAIINGGEVIFEDVGNKRIYQEYSFQDHLFKVESCGYNSGNRSSFTFDNTDIAVKGRGINIVTYDIRSKCLIDSVAFDTCGSSNPNVNRKAGIPVCYQNL